MFKVGDKVKYVSGNYGDSKTNPLFTKYRVLGTVDEVEPSGWIGVCWDNGAHNSYHQKDLKLATRKDIAITNRSVRFLLKYDLDQDPIEEFVTMDEVNVRIKELLNRSDLRQDSMVVYEIKSKKKVKVETKITIK